MSEQMDDCEDIAFTLSFKSKEEYKEENSAEEGLFSGMVLVD